MPIEVLKPGLATSVQDRGREGYYHVGVPPSGALDQFSLLAANLLVGNDAGAAGLECAYQGPQLVFGEDAVVAVCGAEIEPRVDGEAQEPWTSFDVPAGATLTFGHLGAGARAYIAVSGGIDVEEKLGSRSTYALGGLGGFKGRPLAKGDELPVGSANGASAGRTVPEELRPDLPRELEVRVVMGLYDHLLTDEGRATFLESTWALTPVADRVGFRYRGPELAHARARAAVRRGLEPLQHRRRPVPDRVDPGAGRRRADHPAPRRGVGRRLRDDRHRHLGRPRRRRPERPGVQHAVRGGRPRRRARGDERSAPSAWRS